MSRYWISAVRFDDENRHIDVLLEHYDDGAGFGVGTATTRTSVLWRIHDDHAEYGTMSLVGDKWKVGARVGVVTVNGVSYLRTDGECIAADDLGGLPRF